MNKQELDSLIDKSVLGTLTSDEKERLANYIMEQPNTNLEISMRTDIMKGFEYNTDQELRNVLNKIHKDEIFGSNRRKLIKPIGIVLVCLTLILGSIALYNMYNNTNKSFSTTTTTLYANYYKPYVPSLEIRSNEGVNDESYQLFIDAYRSEDYQTSLTTIRPSLSDAENNTLLLAAISAMEVGEDQESLSYYNAIIESNDYYFSDHAKWYKALLLIKMENPNEAKLLLNELAKNPKADHHNESISMLEDF